MHAKFNLRKSKPSKVDPGSRTVTMETQSQMPAALKEKLVSHISRLTENLGRYSPMSDREKTPVEDLDIEPHATYTLSTEPQSKDDPYVTVGIKEARNLLREKDDLIDKLRGLAINDASNTITRLPGQSTLQMPESEILNRWKTYTYEVHNFVQNLLHDPNIDEFKLWASSYQGLGSEHHQASSRHVECEPTQADMVEAVIWKSLVEQVFDAAETSNTFSKALWAGPYAEDLCKLSAKLSRDLAHAENEKQSMFHQWKSLTTSFISAMARESSRGQNFHRVVEELEISLQPLGEGTFGPERRRQMITTLVRNAIDLDRIFCGQQSWYFLRFSPENGKQGREDHHKTNNNLSSSKSTVRSGDGSEEISLTPILYRAGSERGEDFDSFVALG